MRVPKFLLPAPKNWILGPKTAKFGPKLAFWAKYRHFCPIWSKAWPKNDANKLSRWFSVMLVPKLLLTPVKIRILAQKRPNLPQNMHFWLLWAKEWPFWSIWCYARSKKQCEWGASVVFWYMGTRTFAPSQNNQDVWLEKGHFCPKICFYEHI